MLLDMKQLDIPMVVVIVEALPLQGVFHNLLLSSIVVFYPQGQVFFR
jgi:hypothetical protein